MSFDGLDMLLRCSIGMAIHPTHGRNIEVLLAKADVALAVGKRQGGNTAVMFSEEFGEHLRSNFDLEAALHLAVDRNELVLHYQPIIDARTGKVTGAEALMRWMRGGQMITPASFIPLAEENGLVFRMGEWAISEALQQVRRWQLRGPRPDQRFGQHQRAPPGAAVARPVPSPRRWRRRSCRPARSRSN